MRKYAKCEKATGKLSKLVTEMKMRENHYLWVHAGRDIRMRIERPRYLESLIDKRENGLVKVITGMRRCGKSYLLFHLYREYLQSTDVEDSRIIELALDEIRYARYRNPLELDRCIRDKITDNEMHYVFLDEIQKVTSIQNPYVDDTNATIGFVDVLLGLMKMKNVDVYVTGSNSRMLSSDILTEFKDRGDEIRVNPLSFLEFYQAYEGERRNAWRDYYTYGGMPVVMQKKTNEAKSKYLKDLVTKTYIADVVERNKILTDTDVLEDILNMVSSSIGSLTNPTKLANTLESVKKRKIAAATINKYLGYFEDAFIISKAYRFDIKGKRYFDSPLKYYYTDVGLRNARLNFRQQEENHIMENILFNELISRGFDVAVGEVEHNYKNEEGYSRRSRLEVDFVANKPPKRYYIQSTLSIADEEKRRQKTNSLYRIGDSFKKIVVVKDNILPWYDEKGVLFMGIEQFLLDEMAMDLV